MKKFFSLVLALVMALSLTTVAWGADALQSAIAAGETDIVLPAGNYTLPSTTGDVTISGTTDAVITINKPTANTITLKGVTVVGSGLYTGIQHSTKVVYKDCVIKGMQCLYATDVVFINCDFDSNGAEHCIWTYGAQNVTFTDCDFTYGDRCINVYTEAGLANVDVNLDGCTFTTSNTASKGAVEINSSSYGEAAEVSLTGCTAPANGEMAYVSEWDSTGGAKTDIVVDGDLVGGVAEVVGGKQYKTLQEAVDAAKNGDTVKLLTDVTEKVTVTQKPDVKFTIDGANKIFTGTITVDGKSSRYETAGVTIQNVNFVADNLLKDACIGLGVSGNNNTRYTNNVTVKDCTFTGTGNTAVAVKSYTGGDWNLTIEGCTVNSGMHSMLQVTNVEKGLKIADCEVYSESGINLNNTLALEMSGCTFDVQGYAVRVGVDGTVNTTEKTFNITDSTLKSACADGDAVIIFRDSSEKATMTITDTTLTGTTTFAGNTDVTDIFVDGDLVGAVAEVVGGNQYKSLAEAVAAAPAGGTVKLLADCGESVTVAKNLTFDFNGTNFTGFITPAAGYTYMDGVVKKAVASGTTSTGSVTSGTVTATKAKMYRLAAAGGSMTELNIKVEKIEKTTVTGKLVNDVPAYVPNIYKVNNTYYVEVAKADATYALKNNGAYVYLAPAGTTGDVNAVIAKFATAVVLDQYVAAAEDVECGDAVKGTKGAAIYKSGNDAYYADGSDWAYFKGEFVKYNKNAKVAFKAHTWDATSIIVKATDVKGTKVPVTIECEKCEKTFSIVPSAKFDNTWVKGVNYTTDKAVDKYNTAAVKYYIVLENATYTGTYVPSVPSTDKVQSADTFDAGIAMYVGMSVMAAAGSAVVIGKKKD